MNRETLIRLFIDRVRLGVLTIEQVPEVYREEVGLLVNVGVQ